MAEEELTTEQELMARIFVHKRAVAGAVLMQNYIKNEMQSAVKLPPFQMREQADQYANIVMQQALNNGTFDMLYDSAWNKIKNNIPENLNVVMPCN